MQCRHHEVINVPGSHCGLCLPEDFRAHSESDPPPWTTSFEKATCPDCRNRYEEKALRHKELLEGRPTRMDHPEDCAYRRGYSECDCGLDDGVDE